MRPATAGINRACPGRCVKRSLRGAPPGTGMDPSRCGRASPPATSAPRQRGCTRSANPAHRPASAPARAGMYPRRPARVRARRPHPRARARGDEPWLIDIGRCKLHPARAGIHPWTWSSSTLRPAPPRARGDSPRSNVGGVTLKADAPRGRGHNGLPDRQELPFTPIARRS